MQYQPIGGARPAPAQVILRIKRRREEPPVEMVVVEAASQSKKAKGADGLAARLASLSTSAAPNQTGQAGAAQGGSAQQGEKRRFYFTRVDTIEAQEAQQGGGRSSFRPDEDADGSSSYREVRRFKSTTMNGAYPSLGGAAAARGGNHPPGAFHLVDLAPNRSSTAKPQQAPAATQPMDGAAAQAPPPEPPKPQRPQYIFSPLERQLDEAIFRVFQGEAVVDDVLRLVRQGADVNFQRRNADDTTALSAAAYAGDVAGVARLLRAGANARLRDVHGRTALDLAESRGHHGCQILLRQAMAEGAEEEDDEDYVYDVYSIERAGSKSSQQQSPAPHDDDQDGVVMMEGQQPPVVAVRGLAYSSKAGQDEEEEEDAAVLVFEDDSDWSDDEEVGDEDPDSNDENYYANDYPDEPSDNESSDNCPTEDSSDDDGPMRDAGFRMSEATRRHMIEDLARGRSANMARALLGGGPRRFAAGSSSDDDDEDDVDHGLGQYDHRMGAGGIDSSDSDDDGGMGGGGLAAARAAAAGQYARYAYDSEQDFGDSGDDDDDEDDE